MVSQMDRNEKDEAVMNEAGETQEAPADKLSIEEIFTELDGIIRNLENGEVSLEDSFKYYEKINWNSKNEFNEYVSNLEQRKLYDTGEKIKKKDKLLTLSTCEKASDNSRMVVVCKKVKSMTDNGQEDL